MNQRELEKVLNRLRRVEAMLGALAVRSSIAGVDGSKSTQRLQTETLEDEADEDVEHFQNYGVSFAPPSPGSTSLEALSLALGASPADRVVIMVQSPATRPTDAGAGEGGLYNESGWQVFVTSTDQVHIGASGKAAPAKMPRDDRLQTELTRLKGELDAAKTDIQAIVTAITTAAVGSADGGALYKTNMTSSLTTAGTPTLSPASPGATACDNVYGK